MTMDFEALEKEISKVLFDCGKTIYALLPRGSGNKPIDSIPNKLLAVPVLLSILSFSLKHDNEFYDIIHKFDTQIHNLPLVMYSIMSPEQRAEIPVDIQLNLDMAIELLTELKLTDD